MVNPVNAAALLDRVAGFRDAWTVAGLASSYRFGTDPGQPGFLALTAQTDGPVDQRTDPGLTPGTVLAESRMLRAVGADGQDLDGDYDWVYPSAEDPDQGRQTFLYTETGGVRQYRLLDPPIRLAPLALPGRPGALNLSFDSLLYGLPAWSSAWTTSDDPMTPTLASTVVTIPDGTVVGDLDQPSRSYLLKALRSESYLNVTDTPDPSLEPGLAQADALDLDDPGQVPALAVIEDMGAAPAGMLKYSLGRPVPAP